MARAPTAPAHHRGEGMNMPYILRYKLALLALPSWSLLDTASERMEGLTWVRHSVSCSEEDDS